MKKIKLMLGALALISALSFMGCQQPAGGDGEPAKTQEELFDTLFINKIKGANVRLPSFDADGNMSFETAGIIPISDNTNLTKTGLVTAKKEEASSDDIYSFNYTIRAVRELENETIALTYIEWNNPAESQYDGLHSIVYDKTEDRFYFYFFGDSDYYRCSLIISNGNEEFSMPEKDELKIFGISIDLFCSLEELFVFTEPRDYDPFVKGEPISFGNGVITYKGNTANYDFFEDDEEGYFDIKISNSNLGDFLPENDYYLDFYPAYNNNNKTTINFINIFSIGEGPIDFYIGSSSLEGLNYPQDED